MEGLAGFEKKKFENPLLKGEQCLQPRLVLAPFGAIANSATLGKNKFQARMKSADRA